MIIHSLNIYIPVGTYQYNGFTWIVSKDKILQSLAFYPDKYNCVYCYGDSSINCILALQLTGLARTLTNK